MNVLTTAAELEAIAPEWDALLDRSAQSSFNLRPFWLTAWWRHFAPPAGQLRAVACRDGAGTLVGLAPLYLDGREMRFLGHGGEGPSNLTAAIVALRGEEEAVIGAVVDAIASDHDWGRLWLSRMRPELETVRLLAGGLCAELTTNPELNLSVSACGDWDAYRRTLGQAGRKRIQTYARRAAERGCVLRRAATTEELERAFDAYLAWHMQRFDGRAFYDRPRRAAFLREVVRAGFAQDRVRVWIAELEGGLAAVDIAFFDAGVVTDFQGHADPAHAAMRLGHVMTAHLLRDAFCDPSVDEVVLGKAAPHKRHWSDRTWGTVDLVHSREGSPCTT